MILPYTLIAGGFVLCILSAFPIAVSAWLPRPIQFLAGTWFLVVGVALVDLRAAMRDDR